MAASIAFVTGCVVGVASVVLLLIVGFVVRPWRRMVTCGGRGSLFYVLGMRLRGNPPSLIVDAYLALLHCGKAVTLRSVEQHYLANRPRITQTADLIESMKKEAPADSIPIWLEPADVRWLGKHCFAFEGASTEEMDRFRRIGEATNHALQRLA